MQPSPLYSPCLGSFPWWLTQPRPMLHTLHLLINPSSSGHSKSNTNHHFLHNNTSKATINRANSSSSTLL